ncbi:MAG: hypothetical protein ACT4NL_07005 [Pseudomarimonas sp.]
MNRLTVKLLILVSLSLTAQPSHGRAPQDLPVDAVIVDDAAIAASNPLATGKAQAAISALRAGGAKAALAELATLSEPLAFELAASRVVTTLQAAEDSPQARSVLFELTHVPIRVFRRHEETAADWFVPLLDVAGKAQFALRAWDAGAQRRAWLGELSLGGDHAIRALSTTRAKTQPALVEAIGDLAQAKLDAVSADMLLQPEAFASDVWAATAARSGDKRVFAAALIQCDDKDLLALLPAVSQLSAADAGDWLIQLSARPALASAALLALAALADQSSPALEHLIASLDSERLGASAATALAQRPQPDRLALIERLAADPTASPRRLTSLALALRLDESTQARLVLDRLGRDPRLPTNVRAELQR